MVGLTLIENCFMTLPFSPTDGIHLAKNEQAIDGCFAVMAQLRPHLAADTFADRVQNQGADGYLLAYLAVNGQVVSVAGYRVLENLAWGRFLYVDDLVTAADHRGHGCGGRMLAWLNTQAQEAGCDALHLDSGVQRLDAHRFYEAHQMRNTSLHFVISLD